MVPARLQKDSPQCLQRNRRPGGPSFVRYVPLETMLPFPVLPYNEHLGLGQASCCNVYCGLRPLFAILYPPLNSQDSIKGVICQLLKGHYLILGNSIFHLSFMDVPLPHTVVQVLLQRVICQHIVPKLFFSRRYFDISFGMFDPL